LVFPSLYEGFGLPILEAMARGCPVLASQAASIPEVCGSEYEMQGLGNVLYFDPSSVASIAATIQRFESMSLSDVELMTASALEQARRYSWDKTAKRTWDFIRSELSNTGLGCVV
jgi:glycosyltransferase involved in cell wall biosynthesis